MNPSRYLALASLALAGCALAGCALALAPDSARQTTGGSAASGTNAATTPEGDVTRREPGSSGEGEAGSIYLAVRWPNRGPGYRAQVIPESAESLRIRVLDKAGTTELSASQLTRPGGGDLVSTASMEVQTGTDLQVEVKAFRQVAPQANAIPVAQGLSTGVTVAPSTQTDLTIVLAAVKPPSIASISPQNGGPGALVKVMGANFLEGSLGLLFGGDATATVSDLTDSSFYATVPDTAANGLLGLSVDGVATSSPAAFTVLKSLTLIPSGTSAASGSAVTLALTAKDVADADVEDASASFSFAAAGEDQDAVLSGSTFTPQSSGSWVITAKSGSLTATASISSP